MPEVRPDADELLQTVAEFLSHLSQNELSGQAAFHARVAANALTIARREWAAKPAMDGAEVDRMSAILGPVGKAGRNHGALTAELAERLRAGDASLDRAATLAHLRQVVRDKLAISKPKYLTPADQEILAAEDRHGPG